MGFKNEIVSAFFILTFKRVRFVFSSKLNLFRRYLFDVTVVSDRGRCIRLIKCTSVTPTISIGATLEMSVFILN